MPNSQGKNRVKSNNKEPQSIPIVEIINAITGVQITMPGAVTKKKKKFSLTINASFEGASGEINIRIIPDIGWIRPSTLNFHYVSIRRAKGQSLKHRVYFNSDGVVKLQNIGRGDYVLQVF